MASRREAVNAPHTLTGEAILSHFGVLQERGLSAPQVADQLALYGPNALEEAEKKRDLSIRVCLLCHCVAGGAPYCFPF